MCYNSDSMKILVTGGAGFIGSHIVDRLIARRHRVVVVDNLSTGNRRNLNPRAKLYRLDITSPKLVEVFRRERPAAVIHQAAQIDVRKSVADPAKDAQTNIIGSLNLLEQCVQHGVKKVIFASTGGAIYGEAPARHIPTPETYLAAPISPYGVAKLTVEHYLHYYATQYGLPSIALRYSNVYGPRQNAHGEAGVVAIFCRKIFAGEQPVINGNGRQRRDYVYVGDVADANVRALTSPFVGALNIGTGVETSVNQLFTEIVAASGRSVRRVHGPAKPGEQQRSCLDHARARRVLGWRPTVALSDGIATTVAWFADHGL